MTASSPVVRFAQFHNHMLGQLSQLVHGGQKAKYVANANATLSTKARIKIAIIVELSGTNIQPSAMLVSTALCASG